MNASHNHQGDEELRARLREAAGSHRPDRERMLARVQRGMAADPAGPSVRTPHRPPVRPLPGRPAASWLRVAGATAAVASAVALGGYGVASAVRGGPAPAGEQTVATAPDTPARTTPRTVPADRLLWADGSVDPGSKPYWSQSNITVKPKKDLTALTVEVRLSGANHPDDTGSWRSLPAGDFDLGVRAGRDGGLVYRWTLKPGRTVPAGEHVFAAQYHHDDGGRDAGEDTYTVRVSAADEQAEWKGDFE
ncbi:hypothetical protein ACIBI4_30785 [Streptomyces sp. NPDC050418]|uniref:hypothetical protein n=1 Tax=Streptomyces sp. NPDC050418 TaxID=3365612 RepID=UPI0037B959EC